VTCSRARATAAGLAFALGVAGCSGAGGKHSSPTATSTTAVNDTLTVTNLGSCPATPDDLPNPLNAGIKGLDRELVPIAALGVLVCAYAGVDESRVGMGKLPPAVAVPFEQETNALKRDTRPPPACPAVTGLEPSYLLIFASATQRVLVEHPASCTGPTNGVFEAYETERWDDEVKLFSAHP
jgi:hypothetical protein